MKAFLKNYNQAPRKVRLIADLVRGKSVAEAKIALTFLPKKSTPIISGLLNSAVANAGQVGYAPEDLFIQKITVDKGLVMKRMRPFKQGRAGQLRHITSHVLLELGVNAGVVAKPVAKEVAEKPKAEPAAKKTPAKKVAAKKVAAKKTTKKSSSASITNSGETK